MKPVTIKAQLVRVGDRLFRENGCLVEDVDFNDKLGFRRVVLRCDDDAAVFSFPIFEPIQVWRQE